VWLLDLETGESRALTSYDRAVDAAPSTAFPHSPEWSPDGLRLALSTRFPSSCYRIRVIDLASGVSRDVEADPAACSLLPVWSPDGRDLVFARLARGERTLRWSRLGSGTSEPFGFSTGLVYFAEFARDGALLFVGQPNDHPRAVWSSSDRGAAPTLFATTFAQPLGSEWVSRPASIEVRSSGDLSIPVQVFRRVCGDPVGAAVLWVHGGPAEDVAPRWYQEIQALTLYGVTVFAVNYRGSSGYGEDFAARADDLPGQVDDVVAAFEHMKRDPGVDAERVRLLHISSASHIGFSAAARLSGALRGLIDLVGEPAREAADARAIPMLWLSGSEDSITLERTRIAQQLRSQGASIEHVRFDGTHELLDASERSRVWRQIAIRASDGRGCAR
jgi:dipeptidyl aminopeptidase/acylaminoacyl peptidase